MGGKTQGGGDTCMVANQPQLIVDPILYEHITNDQLKAIKLSELSFQRDVSTRAAQAYQEIMTIIDIP